MKRLWVNGEISDSMADKFTAALRSCGDEDVALTVDSIGGQLNAAMKMSAALAAYRGRVEAVLVRADSAALAIAMRASSITCARDGSYLLHLVTIEVPVAVAVTPTEMRAAADSSDVALRKLTRLLEARSGRTDGFWRLMAADERRLSAEQMVELGLADRVSVYPRSYLRGGGVAA